MKYWKEIIGTTSTFRLLLVQWQSQKKEEKYEMQEWKTEHIFIQN